MYYVVSDNSDTVREQVATQEEAYAVIQKYIDDTGFKSYYYRQILFEDNTVMVDYGSHTHFFYISEER